MDYLRPVMYCYLLFAVMNTFLSVLRGAGDMVFPMITSLLSLWLIRLPMAYLMAYFFGKEYIFFSYGGGWLIGVMMAIVLLQWPMEEKGGCFHAGFGGKGGQR